MRRCTARRKPAATASRSSAPQDRRTRVLDVAQSAQRHRHVELAADDFQHARHAFLSHRAQAIEKGAADEGAARAERKRLEHVLAGADAAVEQHLDAAAHRFDHLGQRADRGRGAVELPAAMVGDHDRVGAARGGDLRVLGVEDAFQDQLAAPPVLHPLDVLPAERGVELAGDPLRKRGQAAGVRDAAFEIAERLAFSPQDIQCPGWFCQHIQKSSKRQTRRNRQAVLQVLVALTLDLQVEREHQCGALGRPGALDERGGEAAIAHHVELEPERLRDGAYDVLDRAARGRRGWRAGWPRRTSRGRHSRRSPSRRAFSRAGAGPRRWSPPAWRGILQCTQIMAAARDEQKNPIQVIERMMRLLDVLAQHPEPLGLKQISQYTGLHPSTAHRILAAMSADRLVDRVEPGSYRLGMRLLELGNLVKSRISVRELALPVMRELHAQTGETVNLSVRHGDEIVYVERTSSGRSAMRVVHVIGARAPLHVTAAGKLFLLEEGFARLRDYAKRTGLAPHTRNTIANLTLLERDLERLQRQGWAVDAEEAEIGVRCVAAGLRDDGGSLVAALSLSTPADRMKVQWGPLIKETADQISRAIGHRPTSRIGVA